MGATENHVSNNPLQLQNYKVLEGLSKRATKITFVLRKVSSNESFKEFNLSVFLKRFECDMIIMPKYFHVEKIMCSSLREKRLMAGS